MHTHTYTHTHAHTHTLLAECLLQQYLWTFTLSIWGLIKCLHVATIWFQLVEALTSHTKGFIVMVMIEQLCVLYKNTWKRCGIVSFHSKHAKYLYDSYFIRKFHTWLPKHNYLRRT